MEFRNPVRSFLDTKWRCGFYNLNLLPLELTNALAISLPLWFNKIRQLKHLKYCLQAVGIRAIPINGTETGQTEWLIWFTWYIKYNSLIWNTSLDRFGLCESVITRAYNSDWINFRFNGAHILNKCILHKNRFHKVTWPKKIQKRNQNSIWIWIFPWWGGTGVFIEIILKNWNLNHCRFIVKMNATNGMPISIKNQTKNGCEFVNNRISFNYRL